MNIANLKNSLIGGLIVVIISLLLFNTCKHSTIPDTDPSLFKDTVFLSQWRKERTEKKALVVTYEKRIEVLQQENKTLKQRTIESKNILYNYRSKEDSLRTHLQTSLHYFARKDSSINDTIIPLVNELSSIRDSSDLQCDTTIALFEKEISNRDSVIATQKQIENQLREFNQDQILQTDYLTNQLNIAYKQQKKKTRQNKLLTGGMLILSGIATSLFLIQKK